MRISPHSSIFSEIHEIEKILEGLPADAVIKRFAFEKRLENARRSIGELSSIERYPETLRLTFRGSPVDASYGISADFAGKASNAFADAFAAVLAGKSDRLRYAGPIPGKNRYPLLITGVAVGSFGFEIELPKDRELLDDEIGAATVNTLKNLMRVSASGSDEEVADLVGEVHPRAVQKVVDFLKILDQNHAWCGLEFRDDFFKYNDIDQLKLSEARLKADNISRTEEVFVGEFQGVLPQSRTFEFSILGEGTIIKGKITEEIEDPDVLNREWLHKRVQAPFAVVQVGTARPRYTLTSLGKLRQVFD